jgi:catechol 2,3-dioxygenase-like lactoylglutathione lyase family enzyme
MSQTTPGATSGTPTSGTGPPALAGIHHLKLPVTDLARSLEWYRSRLGYELQLEFVEQGTLMGLALTHPAGGPDLGLRLDPDRARRGRPPPSMIPGKPPTGSSARKSPASRTKPR